MILQEIYDNTKLAAKKTCARKYYYRHVRNWKAEGMAPPLVFGLSWHAALDVVYKYYGQCKDAELVHIAMSDFKQVWEQEGAPDMEQADFTLVEKWNPRLPAVAQEMLHNYIKQRGPLLREMKLIACESPFVVPLWPEATNIWYAGRKDKKFHTNNYRIVMEHKTTTEYKKDGGFRSVYVEGWTMNSQCMGYLYSDNVLSGGMTDYIWVDAALVHKTVHDAFRLIPVQHKYGQLDQWLFDTRREVTEIKRDTAILHDLRAHGKAEGLTFMPVFGRNQESCITAYGKCPYFNVCTQFPNPEQQQEPPPGYVEEEWNPFDILGLQELIDKETTDGSEPADSGDLRSQGKDAEGK